MCLLEIAAADFSGWDMRRNGQDLRARAVSIKQAADEMKVVWSTRARTDGEVARHLGVAGGGKGRDLIVAHMHPFDALLLTQRLGQPVQTVSDCSEDALDAHLPQYLDDKFSDITI